MDVKANPDFIEKAKVKDDGKIKNIVVIYIDALSRTRAHAKLPKSMNFFKKENRKTNEYFYEALKYLALENFTYDNMIAFVYGVMQKKNKQYNWSISKGDPKKVDLLRNETDFEIIYEEI